MIVNTKNGVDSIYRIDLGESIRVIMVSPWVNENALGEPYLRWRNRIRIGVPVKPNVLRSWFSI